MTFDELKTLEPRLQALEDDIRAVKDDESKPYFCANDLWYKRFKRRLSGLVGWERKIGPETLQTSEAYQVSTWFLWDLLPSCRGSCGCL